jgi:uncharacterized protein (DUF433 family)
MRSVEIGHIEIDPEVLGGEPHIAGHRIGVSDVAIWIAYQHETSEAIAEEFHLTLGEVYAALAYYYDHKDEIDRGIEEADRLAEEMARKYPHGWNPSLDAVADQVIRLVVEEGNRPAPGSLFPH